MPSRSDLAGEAKEVGAAALDAVDIDDVYGLWWDDPTEDPFAFEARDGAEVSAIQPKEIESVEVGRVPVTHEEQEVAAAVLADVDDLAIEDRVSCLEFRCQAVAERLEGFMGVPLARDQADTSGFELGDRPEAIVVDLEDPVGMVEGLATPRERHGVDVALRGHSQYIGASVNTEFSHVWASPVSTSNKRASEFSLPVGRAMRGPDEVMPADDRNDAAIAGTYVAVRRPEAARRTLRKKWPCFRQPV
jgi:hypothetical protein